MTSKDRIRVPKYRLHKPSGLAVVTFREHGDIYLGKHGSDESKAEYRRLSVEYMSGSPLTLPSRGATGEGYTVNKMGEDYTSYLKASRSQTWLSNNLDRIARSLKPLNRVYGHTAASSFGPKALKVVRGEMIEAKLSRSLINARVSNIKRMIAWAVSEELLPASSHHALLAVEGLRRGTSNAKETLPVKPVTEKAMRAVLAHVSPQIAAMIEIQWFTAMRPGEVLIMRGCDLDRSGNIWLYRPEHHKTEHHGKDRSIWIGRRAQEVLKPFLKLDPNAYLFSPKDAEEYRKTQMAASRKSKITPSQVKRAEQRRRNPKRVLCECYSRVNYRQAIVRGCEKGGAPPWSPNQLRHSAATRIRKELGIEAARVVLGHSSAGITEVYAEMDDSKALKAMEEFG